MTYLPGTTAIAWLPRVDATHASPPGHGHVFSHWVVELHTVAQNAEHSGRRIDGRTLSAAPQFDIR